MGDGNTVISALREAWRVLVLATGGRAQGSPRTPSRTTMSSRSATTACGPLHVVLTQQLVLFHVTCTCPLFNTLARVPCTASCSTDALCTGVVPATHVTHRLQSDATHMRTPLHAHTIASLPRPAAPTLTRAPMKPGTHSLPPEITHLAPRPRTCHHASPPRTISLLTRCRPSTSTGPRGASTLTSLENCTTATCTAVHACKCGQGAADDKQVKSSSATRTRTTRLSVFIQAPSTVGGT